MQFLIAIMSLKRMWISDVRPPAQAALNQTDCILSVKEREDMKWRGYKGKRERVHLLSINCC